MSAGVFRVLAVLAVAAGCASMAEHPAPEARVAGGSLRGKWLASQPSGRAFAAFEGIPYARPPVGELRFRAPMAAEPWSGVLAADKPGAVCPQRSFTKPEVVEGDEDCLSLNVYYPKLAAPRALPVMFYFHGGGFFSGFGALYTPEYFLDRDDVVYVSFNYRLGALGFLSTGDEAVPGNQGLKDAVLALRWVRDNIAAFGGDPEAVTIFGESAGAAGVEYLRLSPLARGLFRGAVQLSGSSVASWAFYEPALARTRADTLAAGLGCPTHCSKAMRDCLVAKSVKDLVHGVDAITGWLGHPLVAFRPTVEPAGAGAFLDKHPAKVYRDGGVHDVPVVMGVTTNEGCIIVAPIAENETVMQDLDRNFAERTAVMLDTVNLPKSLNERQYTRLRQGYFGDKAVDASTFDQLQDMMTDGYFVVAAFESAKMHVGALKSPVYFYEMRHIGERSFATLFGATKASRPRYGMCHADDLLGMFPLTEFIPGTRSAADLAFTRTLVDLLTTFASTGAPTKDGSWAPVKHVTAAADMEYAFITSDGVAARRGLHPERLARWSSLSANPALALGSTARDEL